MVKKEWPSAGVYAYTASVLHRLWTIRVEERAVYSFRTHVLMAIFGSHLQYDCRLFFPSTGPQVLIVVGSHCLACSSRISECAYVVLILCPTPGEKIIAPQMDPTSRNSSSLTFHVMGGEPAACSQKAIPPSYAPAPKCISS